MDSVLENFEVSIENIKTVINVLKEKAKSDPETAHVLEDSVISLTLKYMLDKNLSKGEMLDYIALLHELTTLEYPKWYA